MILVFFSRPVPGKGHHPDAGFLRPAAKDFRIGLPFDLQQDVQPGFPAADSDGIAEDLRYQAADPVHFLGIEAPQFFYMGLEQAFLDIGCQRQLLGLGTGLGMVVHDSPQVGQHHAGQYHVADPQGREKKRGEGT